MTALLISAALVGGFVAGVLLGVHETLRTIQREYKLTWTLLLLERADSKQKRAEAAQQKEVKE